MPYIVEVPHNLDLEETIKFCNLLSDLPDSEGYIFDFGRLRRIEPFALLFLSTQILRCRKNKWYSNFKAVNFTGCTYAAHMGFFRAFGLKFGNEPGAALGSSTYLPINSLLVSDIRELAMRHHIHPAELLTRKARELSAVLTQTTSGDLFDALTYSIREIFRNVIEHSEARNFGFCAQYWPSIQEVSVSIIDGGIGIRSGLSKNPLLNISTDEEALFQGLQPSISGVAYKGAFRDPDDAWANSGYGLYMTSSMCNDVGSFFIASGSKGLVLEDNEYRFYDIEFEGTALNLTFKTDRLDNLESMLDDYRRNANNIKVTPSSSSLGLI